MTTEEVWKTIEEYPNYEISNYGNFRNKVTNRIRVSQNHNSGYLGNQIMINNKRITLFNHQLVAQYFLPPKPFDDYEVDHIDQNKHNNNFINLRWVTRKENQLNKSKYKNTTSLYRNVSRYRNKWQVQITIDSVNQHVGYWPTQWEAAQGYNDYVTKHNLPNQLNKIFTVKLNK